MNDIRISKAMDNNEFWNLIKVETNIYTRDKSSSVPVEVAKDIVASVLFSIGQYIEKYQCGEWGLLGDNYSFKHALIMGRKIVENKVVRGKKLYRLVNQTMLDIPNVSYYDTLTELNNFFNLYDVRFGAHDVPCMIDYQLIFGNHESNLTGIDYINMYLERFLWENLFCSFFEIDDMISIYEKYAEDYIEQLINLCDPLYANAIGSLILGQNIPAINLSTKDAEQLRDIFLRHDSVEVVELIQRTSCRLCEKMRLSDKAMNYFEMVGSELAVRVNNLKFCDGIGNVFIRVGKD